MKARKGQRDSVVWSPSQMLTHPTRTSKGLDLGTVGHYRKQSAAIARMPLQFHYVRIDTFLCYLYSEICDLFLAGSDWRQPQENEWLTDLYNFESSGRRCVSCLCIAKFSPAMCISFADLHKLTLSFCVYEMKISRKSTPGMRLWANTLGFSKIIVRYCGNSRY